MEKVDNVGNVVLNYKTLVKFPKLVLKFVGKSEKEVTSMRSDRVRLVTPLCIPATVSATHSTDDSARKNVKIKVMFPSKPTES